MNRSILAGSVFLCALLGLVVTQERSKDCVRFCVPVPEVTSVVAICLPTTLPNCSDCRFFDNLCPEIKECNTIMSADGRCLLCPGEVCAYDQKAYMAGEEINSFDQQNKCTCKKDGKVECHPLTALIPGDICENLKP
ncbi:uncharacterized protein LOC110453484 [Mizuhopecten yessoensis]|uniref:Uncharacterized protein n=1 Tax=Mizuhopecten yessoensis TaxID=6573 RepID=A0A210QHB2_MIZYE|nr:uncharacterized protein LOC110453484 [Mizuhopecten yessoensis]OWF48124.1 hypothetical protein KP79_PYT24712 [Mizuhopecten yessoensis]